MKVTNMSFYGLVSGLVFLLASVSGAGVMAAEKSKSSGFLSPAIEANLKQDKLPDGRKLVRWRDSQLNRKNYQSIMVDPVIFYPSPHPGPQISSSTLEAIGQHLTYTLRQKIGAKVKVVDEAGPGVLRVQAAITSVTAEAGLSGLDVIPIHLLFSAASSAAGTKKEDVTAMVEFRITDSVSGENRGAAKMKLEGKQLKGKKDKMQLEDLQKALDDAAGDSAYLVHDAVGD